MILLDACHVDCPLKSSKRKTPQATPVRHPSQLLMQIKERARDVRDNSESASQPLHDTFLMRSIFRTLLTMAPFTAHSGAQAFHEP